MSPEQDNTDVEAQLYDDIDAIAGMAARAIAAQSRGDASELAEELHNIHDTARAYTEVNTDE